jgi:hypothetical protein
MTNEHDCCPEGKVDPGLFTMPGQRLPAFVRGLTCCLCSNRVLEVHGGLEQWRRFTKIEIVAVTGGGLFPLKGLQPDLATRRMTVWLKEERASVWALPTEIGPC